LTYTEVQAWSSNMRLYVREEEVTMLLSMDDVYLNVSASEHEATLERKAAQAASAQSKTW